MSDVTMRPPTGETMDIGDAIGPMAEVVITGSLRDAAGNAVSPVQGQTAYSHSQTTGNPHNTTAANVGADPAGSAAAVADDLTSHESETTSAHGGIVASTDARLSDARTPTAHKTSHEPGGADAMTVDAAAATGSLRTLGTSATSACAGNDSRLTDARTPAAHAASHATAGGDAVAPSAIGAEPALGNPLVSGYALVSTTGGVRSWAAAAADIAAAVILLPTTSARNVIQPSGAAVVPLVAKGFSAQTADLQQWQNSAGVASLAVTAQATDAGGDYISLLAGAATTLRVLTPDAAAADAQPTKGIVLQAGRHRTVVGTPTAVTLAGGTALQAGAITVQGGEGSKTNQNSGGVAIQSGDVTVNGSFAVGAISLLAGKCNSFNSGSSVAGGAITLTTQSGSRGSTGNAGAGGPVTVALGAGTAATGNTYAGGAGGAFAVTGGVGGEASGTGGTGGAGSSMSLTAGAGGNATGASGTRTGGNGGSIALTAGSGGTGATANGAAGAIALTGRTTITPLAATSVVLTAKGFASQTANLQEWQDSASAVKAAVLPDGSVQTAADAFFYMGDSATDGSWRIGRSGTGLVMERLESGSWVTKSTIAA